MATLPADKSAAKKIKVTASCFMGLAHLLYLKDFVKGALFALCEILFIVLLPTTVSKLIGMVTLGTPHPELPVKQRDNSIFMLIDGILFIAILVVFVIVYLMSIKSAEKDYAEYCRTGSFKTQKELLNTTLGKSFPIVGLAPAFIMVVVFVVVPLLFKTVPSVGLVV